MNKDASDRKNSTKSEKFINKKKKEYASDTYKSKIHSIGYILSKDEDTVIIEGFEHDHEAFVVTVRRINNKTMWLTFKKWANVVGFVSSCKEAYVRDGYSVVVLYSF